MSQPPDCLCGGKPQFHFLDGVQWIACEVCGLQTHFHEEIEAAKHEWATLPERTRH